MAGNGSLHADVAGRALSRMVGEARGERRFTRSVCVALAGAARVEIPVDVGVAGPLAGSVPAFGWPDARTVFRRLGLSPEELTLIWHQEVVRRGGGARLPAVILDALFPRPVPVIAARLVGLGPAATLERLEAFCRAEALRAAPLTRARPSPGRISAGTIDAILAAGQRFARAVSDAVGRAPDDTLDAWGWFPAPLHASALGALPAHTDRSAPAVEEVAALLDALGDAIERSTAGSHRRRRLLRNRLLLALLATTGARVGAVARLLVCDYAQSRPRAGDSCGPALRLRPGKTLPTHVERWKPLPAELAGWLEQHVAESRLDARSPLFPTARDAARPMTPDSLTKLLSADDPLALGRSAHTLRHLAEQLAFTAGRRRTVERDEPIPAQAYADALLDHAFASDPLGYKDVERRREELAGVATDYIWQRLRGQLSHSGSERERALREQRQALLTRDPKGLSDRELLELLVTHAQLTTTIDDLRARRR